MEGLGLAGSGAAGAEAESPPPQPANAAAKAVVNTTFFMRENRAYSAARDNIFWQPRMNAIFRIFNAEEGGVFFSAY
jgi:hypothetical protein